MERIDDIDKSARADARTAATEASSRDHRVAGNDNRVADQVIESLRRGGLGCWLVASPAYLKKPS